MGSVETRCCRALESGSAAQARMRRVVSQPSRFGMSQSIKMASGIDGPAGVSPGPRRRRRPSSIAPELFELHGENLAIDRVVLDDKHVEPEPGLFRNRERGRAGGGAEVRSGMAKKNVEPLPGTLSTSSRPPMSFDKAAADRQSQPGAAIAAGRRGVRLPKPLEESCSRVVSSMPMPVSRTSKRIASPAGAMTRRTLPPGGVNIDAVRQEIEQDLAQAEAVRPRNPRKLRRRFPSRATLRLRGSGREEPDAIRRQHREVEGPRLQPRADRPRFSRGRARRR